MLDDLVQTPAAGGDIAPAVSTQVRYSTIAIVGSHPQSKSMRARLTTRHTAVVRMPGRCRALIAGSSSILLSSDQVCPSAT